jgi:hypothetical protein
MKKNKILGIVIAAVIGVSSVVPAFAEGVVSQNTAASTTQTQTKQLSQEEILQKLTQKAAKLGVDITGLTNDQARDKIRAAEASKLGIDITGLTKDEANAKIKQAKEANATKKITEIAAKLGVDITGLSNEDARAKLVDAEAAKLGINITGLTKDEVKAKVKEVREANATQ